MTKTIDIGKYEGDEVSEGSLAPDTFISFCACKLDLIVKLGDSPSAQ